jgi:hypothetical protein
MLDMQKSMPTPVIISAVKDLIVPTGSPKHISSLIIETGRPLSF